MLLSARYCPGIWHPVSPMWVTQSLGKIPTKACLTNLPQKQKKKNNRELRLNIIKVGLSIFSKAKTTTDTFVLIISGHNL